MAKRLARRRDIPEIGPITSGIQHYFSRCGGRTHARPNEEFRCPQKKVCERSSRYQNRLTGAFWEPYQGKYSNRRPDHDYIVCWCLFLFWPLLILSSKDMESFFEPCANKIVELIENQREQIEDIRGLRVRLKVLMNLRKELSLKLIYLLECVSRWWVCGIFVFAGVYQRIS